MEHIANPQLQSPRLAAHTDINIYRQLFVLSLATALGAITIWQLRQEWASDWMWPWALLIIAMFAAAASLSRIKLWLPGEAILPRLEAFPAQRTRVAGMLCIVAALAITGLLMWRLWPDYHQWQGMQLLWLAALALFIFGAWSLGAVGRGSSFGRSAHAFGAGAGFVIGGSLNGCFGTAAGNGPSQNRPAVADHRQILRQG